MSSNNYSMYWVWDIWTVGVEERLSNYHEVRLLLSLWNSDPNDTHNNTDINVLLDLKK